MAPDPFCSWCCVSHCTSQFSGAASRSGCSIRFSSVLSCPTLLCDRWLQAHQASLISSALSYQTAPLRPVMPSNHCILCRPPPTQISSASSLSNAEPVHCTGGQNIVVGGSRHLSDQLRPNEYSGLTYLEMQTGWSATIRGTWRNFSTSVQKTSSALFLVSL